MAKKTQCLKCLFYFTFYLPRSLGATRPAGLERDILIFDVLLPINGVLRLPSSDRNLPRIADYLRDDLADKTIEITIHNKDSSVMAFQPSFNALYTMLDYSLDQVHCPAQTTRWNYWLSVLSFYSSLEKAFQIVRRENVFWSTFRRKKYLANKNLLWLN